MVVVEKKVNLRQKNEEEPHVILQNLIRAELTLTEEKKKLETIKEQLALEVQKRIENKKSNIQKLRAEITDLKLTCDELSKLLQTEITST